MGWAPQSRGEAGYSLLLLALGIRSPSEVVSDPFSTTSSWMEVLVLLGLAQTPGICDFVATSAAATFNHKDAFRPSVQVVEKGA